MNDRNGTGWQPGRLALHEELGRFLGEGVPAFRRETFAEHFVPREAGKDEYLLRVGDQWKQVIFVESGLLRLFYPDMEGREFNKEFCYENQLFWPIAPSARSHPSLFSIATLERSKLWIADFEAFQSTLREYGCWERFALPFAEWLAEQKFLREYEFLLFPAEERYCRFCRTSPELVSRLPDYHLASYLGMTNVTLSRIKRKHRVLT